MLTLRQRLFLITGSIVLIIVLVLLGMWYAKRTPKVTTAPTTPTTTVPVAPTETAVPVQPKPALYGERPITAPPKGNPEELFIRQLAAIFTERFASYSNEGDNKHIADVLPLTTLQMQAWIKKQAVPFGTAQGAYRGVTTRVLATTLVSKEETKVVVQVSVQQDFSAAAPSTSTPVGLVQKKAKVNLVKIQGEWKIEGFFWE